ncbi:restriction endonuclease subunit S [Burkholderia cenocepacia]|uniref:restriction endonuclease subunit S n=1 Tax=Burkholderia cenocepacia TaxID=95486 RepID=UPI001B9DEB4F|nr:restriction endonuclease subunit S [Burkholderia cenocepacia]MBR8379001.1 restriction endonuclease subunit S [Burkholderia cenocepacia]
MNNKDVAAMCEQNNEKTALVPRLRFPEFRGAGEWATEPLSKIARITQGGTPSTSVPEYWNGEIQWITPAEMGKDVSPYVSRTIRTLTQNGLQNCSSELLPEGSIILSTRAPIGHLAINTQPMAINQGCRGIVAGAGYESKFIYYYLGNNRSRLEDIGAGNTFKELSGSALREFAISIPKSDEQKKIAEFLSSLDDVITAESRKLDALKIHKNGLLQQLFPCEGETVPRLRFPEFRDAEAWKEVELSTRIDLISGLHLAPDEYADAGDVPYFTGPSDYANDLALVGKWTSHSANSGRAGDILITVKGSGVGELLYLELDEVAMGRQLMAVRPRGVHGEFVFHFLATQRQRLIALASGNLIPGLSRGDILSLTVSVPEREEQQAIADCLSALDDVIAVQSQKIDGLQAHKKGLMQRLFPALSEVQE